MSLERLIEGEHVHTVVLATVRGGQATERPTREGGSLLRVLTV